MSIHSSFYRFQTSTDYASNSDGFSSVAFHTDSNQGTLLLALDSDHNYHITGLFLNEAVSGKAVSVRLETIGDGGITAASVFDTDVSATAISADIKHSYTVNVTPSNIYVPFNPPINVRYSSDVAYVGLRIAAGDSDGTPAIAYSGFTTRN